MEQQIAARNLGIRKKPPFCTQKRATTEQRLKDQLAHGDQGSPGTLERDDLKVVTQKEYPNSVYYVTESKCFYKTHMLYITQSYVIPKQTYR